MAIFNQTSPVVHAVVITSFVELSYHKMLKNSNKRSAIKAKEGSG